MSMKCLLKSERFIMQVHLTHFLERRMVTPLNVTAASFSFFSAPSPYTVLTACIAAAMRSLSAGSATSFLCLGAALEALREAFRTRLAVLLGAVGRCSGLVGSNALMGSLVLDRADEGALFLRELLVFRDDLTGKTSFSSR